jgi:uncharacterized membrane protein YhaH (DUF805 family)
MKRLVVLGSLFSGLALSQFAWASDLLIDVHPLVGLAIFVVSMIVLLFLPGKDGETAFDWFFYVLRLNYANFNGRAHRGEFWKFWLFNTYMAVVLAVFEEYLDWFPDYESALASIYSLAVLLPSIALGARRLHDTNRSGWYQLIPFIPVVGFLVLMYFYLKDSDSNANKYGPNPKIENEPTLGAGDAEIDSLPVVDNEGNMWKENWEKSQGEQQSSTKVVRTTANKVLEDDNYYYAFAWDEIEQGLQEKGLWAKLYASNSGDQEKTTADYLTERVATLKDSLWMCLCPHCNAENLLPNRDEGVVSCHKCSGNFEVVYR